MPYGFLVKRDKKERKKEGRRRTTTTTKWIFLWTVFATLRNASGSLGALSTLE